MSRLLIDERIAADGTHARSWLALDDHRLGLYEDATLIGEVAIVALDAIMKRYGRPLDAEIALDGPALELPGGRCLRRLHYHAIVDAEGRDYLVWERTGQEPLAVIATMATAALRHLAMRLPARAPSDS